MDVIKRQEFKKVFLLGAVSILASILFSFLGAPFLRAFAVTSRSKVFWSVGIVFVMSLFVFGIYDFKILQAAVYVGAIWMTLGAYNELEKRGINWKKASTISLIAGILFAGFSYFFISKNPVHSEYLNQIVEPIYQAINKAFPDNPVEIKTLIGFLPGVFVASLLAALAFGFLLEPKVVKTFGLQKFKVASSLKWLEFRLPDLFIWTTMFSLLFSIINFKIQWLETISINILIVAAVAFLIQGLIVIEFIMRLFRFGPVSKAMMYLLIFFQLAPFIVFIGLIDYWADFRKFVRNQGKTKVK